MREYQFYASEPRDEMLMGICFPAALMLPTSILGAVMWYFIPDYHPLSKSLTGFGWVAIVGVIIGFLIMSLVKRYCIRKYTVQVSEKTILIDSVESSIFAGSTKEDIQAMTALYQVLQEVSILK